jgi:hypothetical protein
VGLAGTTGTRVGHCLTGADISGGFAWVGIVLLRRQRLLSEQQSAMRAELERRLDELEGVDARLAEMEGRLDFTERILAKDREGRSLPPPA